MIYLDTSALVKLLVDEAESADLAVWLQDDQRGQVLVTSALSRVELLRAVARLGLPEIFAEDARALLDSLDTIPLTDEVIALAESIGPPMLRSLDAIHLAAASLLGANLTALVTYDTRLYEAAAGLNMRVEAPGRTR